MSSDPQQQQGDPFADFWTRAGVSVVPGAEPLREPRRPRSSFDVQARVRDLAPAYGVPEDLALKVLGQESGGQHYTAGGGIKTSTQGARGAMQVLPATGAALGYDVNDPEQNVRAGLDYLGRSYKRWNGDEALTLAGYHSGIEDAEKALRNPRGNPKTHGYVKSILGDQAYNQTMTRYGHQPAPSAFDEFWSTATDAPGAAPDPFNDFWQKSGIDQPAAAAPAPKQIYADELAKLAQEKYGGDETKATTALFNQGYQIMQRVKPDDEEKPVTLRATDKLPMDDVEGGSPAYPHEFSVADLVEPQFDEQGNVAGFNLRQGVTPEQFIASTTEKGLAQIGFTPDSAKRYKEQQGREPLTFRRGVRPEDTAYSVDELLKGIHSKRQPNTVYTPGQSGEPTFRFVVPGEQHALYQQFLSPENAEQQAAIAADIKQRRMEGAKETADPLDRAAAVALDAATGGAGNIADNPAAPDWIKTPASNVRQFNEEALRRATLGQLDPTMRGRIAGEDYDTAGAETGRIVGGIAPVVAAGAVGGPAAATVAAGMQPLVERRPDEPHYDLERRIQEGALNAALVGTTGPAGEMLTPLAKGTASQVAARSLGTGAGFALGSAELEPLITGQKPTAAGLGKQFLTGAVMGGAHGVIGVHGEPALRADEAARSSSNEPRGELHHEDFGRVTLADDQAGVPVGKLRVVDDDGAAHVIQHPRLMGNQKAAFVRGEQGRAGAARPQTEAPATPGDPFDDFWSSVDQAPPPPTASVDAAAHAAATSPRNALPEPTPAQVDAGNYQKGHVRIAGLDISIENPQGSKRQPEWPALKSHYGYIRQSEGGDGEHIDVFVKPGTKPDYNGPVFVVDQTNKSGAFDEHKVMLGFPDEQAARAGYAENYTKGWKVGPIRQFDSPVEFHDWLKNGDTTKPAAAAVAGEPSPRPLDEVVRTAAESKPAADEPEFVRAARERLRAALQGNTLSANPVHHLFDTALIAGYDVIKFTMDKAAWAREMTLRLGQKVKPILDDVWDHLTTGKFGPADVKRQLEQTRLVPAKMVQDLVSGERPEHVNSIVDFLNEQRNKVVKGAMTSSDVAKAYYITVASQGTDAIKVETLQRKLGEAGVDLPIPDDYATANKKGEKVIRPEDAAGVWLLSQTGQRALADLEQGKFNEAAWREGAKVRAAFGDDRVTKNNVLGQAARGSFNMRNLADLVPALNEAKGDSRKVAGLAGKLNGVGIGKTPFLKHLLGLGDSPTIDAVEINAWLTGRGSTKGQAGRAVELARAVKDFTGNPGVMEAISDRINRRFNDLRRSGVAGQDLSPDTFGHVVHHWLWDAMKGTVNPQKGMYDAMRSEPDFVARSRARLRELYSGQRLNANPVQDIYDLAIVMGADLYGKARGFAEWSRRMVDELGPDVGQHLPEIWGQLEGESMRLFDAGSKPLASSGPAAQTPSAPPSRPGMPPPDESVMLGGTDANGKTSPLSTLDSYIRANILAGPSPITHKLGSLTASAIADEAARPFAAAVDAVRSKLGSGQRALFEDPRGLARATVAAVTKGIPEMGQILRRGYTADQIARGELPNEVKGRPVIGDYINLVFRAYKSGVHPFSVFAYTRALENQALALAKLEAKTGEISKSEIRSRADEVARGDGVSPATAGQMELNASLAAADATFLRDNPVSRKWSDLRKALGPGWAFGLNRVFEFTRTPLNAVVKTIELTPGLGQAKELLINLRSKAKTGQWLPNDVDKVRFAKAWGRLPVGVGLFALGAALHRRGMMTGFVDDRKQKAMDRAEGKTPGSLQIAPNTWLDVMRFSPVGAVMAMGATWDYYSNGQGESRDEGGIKDVMSDLYHTLLPTVESLPFAQNPQRIIDAKAQAAKLLPVYSTLRDVYRGNQSTIGAAVPPARWLFGQAGPDVLGRPPEDQGFASTVLHVRHGQPSGALDELRANGLAYSRPWRRPDESSKSYNARVKAQGAAIEKRVASLKQSPLYTDGAGDFKQKALEIATLAAREDAEMGRTALEGDASVLLFNARVGLETKALIRAQRQTAMYRGLSQPERQHFEKAIQERMQGAHAMLSGSGNPGARISAAAVRFRELMSDRGSIIREAVKRAKGVPR